MKALHISHHDGCVTDLAYVFKQLGHELETFRYPYGYNIGIERADSSWQEFKEKFNSYDLIITSDTAPLSRIITRHLDEYNGKLIIWICNRFDYVDQSTNDCKFPDPEYYFEFQKAYQHPRVSVVSYTRFEHYYAKYMRQVNIGELTIEPTGGILESDFKTQIPSFVEKSKTFFIPTYHNDMFLLDLEKKCDSLGISAYRSLYNGMNDLKDFRGIIHIPYAWSNLAFFQAMYCGIPYVIPSKKFLLELRQTGNFFWSPPFVEDKLELSEWYHPRHVPLLTFFDSWNDLKAKVESFKPKLGLLDGFSRMHIHATLEQWRLLIV